MISRVAASISHLKLKFCFLCNKVLHAYSSGLFVRGFCLFYFTDSFLKFLCALEERLVGKANNSAKLRQVYYSHLYSKNEMHAGGGNYWKCKFCS